MQELLVKRAAHDEASGEMVCETFRGGEKGKFPTGADAGSAGHFKDGIAGVEAVRNFSSEGEGWSEKGAGEGGVDDVEEVGIPSGCLFPPGADGGEFGGIAPEELKKVRGVVLSESTSANRFDAGGAAMDPKGDSGEGWSHERRWRRFSRVAR